MASSPTLALSKQWTTHIPMLIKVVQMSTGPVLELGAGIFSTPLLHWLCAEQRRLLITYEDSEEFYSFARKFMSRTHLIRRIEWRDLKVDRHWGVVFIDHDMNRGVAAILFKDSADYIVMHDTEQEITYGYNVAFPYFKYRYDWKFCPPWTSVVSNFKNVSELMTN